MNHPICMECECPIEPHEPIDGAQGWQAVWGVYDPGTSADGLTYCPPNPDYWGPFKDHKPFPDLRTQPILDHTTCFTCGQEFGDGPHRDTAHEPNYIEEPS